MLKDFGAFRIVMYFEDHNPPHVHVIGRNFQALVGIADGDVLEGQIPAKERKKALAWIERNEFSK